MRNTGPARAVALRRAAERAADDPAKLSKAVRIVRAAIERQQLTLSDLTAPADGRAA
ncbi:hypothetical protein [Asanoa iriomotensis]|uniref:Uncharacterized protein n=1 Tax=Asanoa iriomotensis TaxID=234613 RepID=A0ABQ4CBJ8_9ACTN|nr:hypothetical protein [Asanoa iriomotensis]GIF59831.1 hypothetical protein Air01nite_59260 [Asanoa iriomotensis]